MKRALLSSTLLFGLGCSSGCGGAVPSVPDVPGAMDCQVIDGAALAAAPDKGLKGLLPGRRPGVALPMTVGQMLSMRGVPADTQWRALPPGADAALVSTVQNAAAPEAHRARAMSGLAVRKAEAGRVALTAVLEDAAAPAMLRRSAARALAAGYLSSIGAADDAGPALIAALTDADAMLREAVVKALAPHAARADLVAGLTARRAVESNPLVKEALTQALAPAP